MLPLQGDGQDLRRFVHHVESMMAKVDTQTFRDETFDKRVTRRFPKNEVASFLGIDVGFLGRVAPADEGVFPTGVKSGREISFLPEEINLIRAIMGSKKGIKKQHLHWRAPGDPVTVVTFGALKGGTGKTLSAAHFAQYLSLAYGLRVGVIDSDPQATCSLYFAGKDNDLFSPECKTLIDFMGLAEIGSAAPALLPPSEQNDVWQSTPWPGIRLMPGGLSLMTGDTSLMMMARNGYAGIYRVLRDAIDVWDRNNQPITVPSDLRRPDGAFDADRYKSALTETLDVIVIDQQPSMTYMQMAGVVAANTLVVPMTMKGFDLSTLTIYASGLADYLDYVAELDEGFPLGAQGHVILPTIVQGDNSKDVDQIADLRDHGGSSVAEVWYDRSGAVANAAEQYMSIYEYTPTDGRRASARNFMRNANAVNDYLSSRTLPHLPSRGFADEFISQRWGDS